MLERNEGVDGRDKKRKKITVRWEKRIKNGDRKTRLDNRREEDREGDHRRGWSRGGRGEDEWMGGGGLTES